MQGWYYSTLAPGTVIPAARQFRDTYWETYG